MIASILNLNKRSCASIKACNQMFRCFANSHNVVYDNPLVILMRAKILFLKLFHIAKNLIYLRHLRERIRINLSGTACDDDFPMRKITAVFANRLATLMYC